MSDHETYRVLFGGADLAHNTEMVASFLNGFRLKELRALAHGMPGKGRAKKDPLITWIVRNNLAEAQPLWAAALEEIRARTHIPILKAGTTMGEQPPHVLVTGNLVDGFTFIGPVTPNDPALDQYVDTALSGQDWHYVQLVSLEEAISINEAEREGL